MRFLLIIGALLLSMSASGVAQEPPFKVKPSSTDAKTEHKSAPPEKSPAGSTAAARDLKSIERQSARPLPAAPRQAPVKKRPVALKPENNKPNPPINFKKGQASASGVKLGSNPYKGRLKQKGSH